MWGLSSCLSPETPPEKPDAPSEAKERSESGNNPGHKIEEIFLEGGRTGILMIHGYSSSSQAFKPMATALNQRGYTVYCLLLPGHGQTVDELDSIEKEDYYKHVEAGFKRFSKKVDSLYVVGQSLGSLLTFYLAANHDIDGIIVMSLPAIGYDEKFDRESVHAVAHAFVKVTDRFPRWTPKYFTGMDHFERYGLYSVYSTKGLEVALEITEDTQGFVRKTDEPVLIMQAPNYPLSLDHQSSVGFVLDEVKSKTKNVVYYKAAGHAFYLGEKMPLVVEEICKFIDGVEESKRHGMPRD